MERRHFLRLLAVVFLGAQGIRASAQSSAIVRQRVAAFKEALPGIFEKDLRFAPERDKVTSFLAQEYNARLQFFEGMQDATAEQVRAASPPETEAIVEFAGKEAGDFVLRPADVQQLGLDQTREPRTGDTPAQVISDIVKETLGLEFLDDVFLTLINGDTRFAVLFRKLSEQVGLRDYNGAVETLKTLVLWMSSTAGFDKLKGVASRLPPGQLRRRLIGALGSRMVPFVGWAFLGACFMASLYSNRKRLAVVFR